MTPTERDEVPLGVVSRVAAPLRQQTLDLLRDAILDFRLRPGQRLVERELIELMGVSRTTIREVLRELATEGLVTTIPQKGAIVVNTTPEGAQDLYEVRAALESLAARRFVEYADAEHVAALRAAVDEFAELARARTPDIRAMLQAKDRFYAELIAGSGNGAIEAVLSSVRARVRVLRAISLSEPGRPAAALTELEELLAAIEARDADAAARSAARHLEHAARIGLRASANGTTPPFG
ncbi:MAG: GntR family transcriptional regulator [Solirubrobacteraceae bacterium]